MLLLTAEQTRALDRRTIEGGRSTGFELMRRAGIGVAAAIESRYGSLLALRALVLCGTGGNGGDGFIAAADLRERGASPRVVVMGDPQAVRGDAARALETLREHGVPIERASSEEELRAIAGTRDHWDLGVDALLGTGSRGGPEGAVAAGVQILRELDDAGTPVIAVDLPTGVSADTGEIARRAVRADLTVTFGAPKRGHVLYPGRAFTGELRVVDIGLDAPGEDDPLAHVHLATARSMARLVPRRDPRAHKGSTGRVLLVGGSPGLTGAITLAARSASRAGAGYVHVAVPRGVAEIMATKLIDQIPVACAEGPTGSLSESARDTLGPLLERVDAVALGPGLSRDQEAGALARRLVAEVALPMVVDADALFALARDTAVLDEARGPRVLTPHLVELSRLTGETPERLECDRIDVASRWAVLWKAVLVMKGAPTVTGAPNGHATVNPTGNPALATAGTGDVLTGIVASLLAQGLAPRDAAALGVYVHGLAADRLARLRGGLGLVASDIVEALPETLRELEQRTHDRTGDDGGRIL